MLHCAEDIADAIREPKQDIDTNVIREAVETIGLCVSHQKNIVDDVLSFSKLDASLLSLVPKPYQPHRQLASTLKMFQHEFRKQQLQFGYRVDDAYFDSSVKTVMADMPRIGQVLINLITNGMGRTNAYPKSQELTPCSFDVQPSSSHIRAKEKRESFAQWLLALRDRSHTPQMSFSSNPKVSRTGWMLRILRSGEMARLFTLWSLCRTPA